MDDKTESLRDLFMEVSDSGTVTESQAADRGSLATDEGRVDDRLREAIEGMRERYDFETDLDDDVYSRLVRGFYDGRSDANLADELEVGESTVFFARMDLHLLREGDREIAELTRVADLAAEGATPAAVADELAVPESRAERALAVLAARDRSRRASRRFTTEFEEILTDADLSVRLTAAMEDDGLREAAEDIESDVEF